MNPLTIIWSIVSLFLTVVIGFGVWGVQLYVKAQMKNQSKSDDNIIALNENMVKLNGTIKQQMLICDNKMQPMNFKLEQHGKMIAENRGNIEKNHDDIEKTRISLHKKINKVHENAL